MCIGQALTKGPNEFLRAEQKARAMKETRGQVMSVSLGGKSRCDRRVLPATHGTKTHYCTDNLYFCKRGQHIRCQLLVRATGRSCRVVNRHTELAKKNKRSGNSNETETLRSLHPENSVARNKLVRSPLPCRSARRLRFFG